MAYFNIQHGMIHCSTFVKQSVQHLLINSIEQCIIDLKTRSILVNLVIDHVALQPGFYMSEKSQTTGMSLFPNRSRFYRLVKTRHPQPSGMVGDKSGAFLLSRQVPEFCDDRQFSRHIGKHYLGRPGNSKITDRLGFSRLMKSSLSQ